jgi:hypothetical protein
MLGMDNCVFIHPLNLYFYHKNTLQSKRCPHGRFSAIPSICRMKSLSETASDIPEY